MNSVRLARKCVPLAVIQRNQFGFCHKRHASQIVSANRTSLIKTSVNKDTTQVQTLQVQVYRSFSRTLNQDDSDMSLTVDHDVNEKEFSIKMTEPNEDKKAYLTYVWENPKFADLQHTFVPEEFRGKGVAKLLAEAAFEYFVKEGATMRLTCTYLHKFAKDSDNPRYNSNICWD